MGSIAVADRWSSRCWLAATVSGSRKVDRRAQVGGDVDVPGHFDALIPRDGPDQRHRQVAHGLGDRDAQAVSVVGRQVQQPNQTCLSLDEGANRRALVLTNDEISFPVARLGAVGGSNGRW